LTIRVAVIDDSDLLRAGLVTVLSSDPDVAVVGEAGDGPNGTRLAVDLRPDVVLMDVEMPGGDGITATRRIRELAPSVSVLILTMFDLDEYVVEALRAGAAGFLLKTTAPRQLLASIKACAAGETSVGPTVMQRLIDSYLAQPGTRPAPSGLEALTPRELDVLKAMSEGLSNAEIGQRLYLAETTVKTHVARVLAKLGVRNRVQAVVLAHDAGVPRL
jgi:DNA-binding NarL/FixJ family response regulator